MVPPVRIDRLWNIATWQDQIPWQPFREGISIHQLYSDGKTGASAALLRYDRGAKVPLHEHQGYEHIFVLEGYQGDDQGEYGKGSLVINPPGTRHEVISKDGCIVLIIWEKPVNLCP